MTIRFASIGALGAGFSEDSLDRAVDEGIDFVGADAGSADGGPFALGGQGTNFPDAVCERDLSLLLRGARRAGVPLLVGSAHSSGRDWGVDAFAGMVRRTAARHGLPLRLARVYSELSPEQVAGFVRAGRVRPLDPAPPYDEAAARRSTRIVGVMGVEPFQRAIELGADVVIAGRATDPAIFAAIPMLSGVDPGTAWHAGKIAECGTSSAEPRRRLDVLSVRIDGDGGDGCVVAPYADDLRCTPFSVAAQQLHEVTNPYLSVEPGWLVDMSGASYTAESDRSVRVRGTVATPQPYTVKLEGVEPAGYQHVFMLGLRDPTIVGALDQWRASVDHDIRVRAAELLSPGGLERSSVHVRIYGRDGVMGPLEPTPVVEGHEVFVVVDVVSPDPADAAALASIVWYAYMHAKSPTWRGHGTVAWPFNPPVVDRGLVHRFNVHHAVEVDDPLELFRVEVEEVGR